MNNYIKVFAASVLSFMVVSCSLDEVNYSAESSEEYIKDETQYEELVSAAYMRLRPLISSTTTDLMWYGTDIYSRTGEMNDAHRKPFLFLRFLLQIYSCVERSRHG